VAEQFKRIVRIPSHRRLSRANLFGKVVLVRSDFNVPIEDGKITSLQKIAAGVPTIKKIFEKDAKQINIICHLGQPKSADKNFSTALIAGALMNLLHLRVHPVKVKTEFKSPSLSVCYQIGEKVRLFENLRFDPREQTNSAEFAGELKRLGEVLVLDAFASFHRLHTSVVALQKKLPTYAGLLVEREVNALFKLVGRAEAPFVAIIGGAKIEDKLPVVEALSKICKAVLVGGQTANAWLSSERPKADNVYLPTDGVNERGQIVALDEKSLHDGIYDIGPQTVLLFKSVLASAKTVFWNGNLGRSEMARFSYGTREIARYVARLKAEKVVSGGNTAAVIDELALGESFDFVSTGGGATSDFIAGKKMPALELLLK